MTRRRLLIWITCTLWVGIILELSSGLALQVLDRSRGLRFRPISTQIAPDDVIRVRQFATGMGYIIPSATLGWTIKPGGALGNYRATSQGLRGDRVYDSVPPAGVLRIAAFGDSFTHGDEVSNPDAWTAQLDGPGVEVLNFGVPGYGFDQAYLRYVTEGRQFRPHVVLIALYAEDVNRGLNIWRPFYLAHYDIPSGKPRFRLADSLRLEPNPLVDAASYGVLLANPDSVLRAIGRNDYFYSVRERAGPLDDLATVRFVKLARRVLIERRDGTLRHDVLRPGDTGPRLAIATLRKFVAAVRADSATPVLLLFPNLYQQLRYQRDGTNAVGALADSLHSVDAVNLHAVLGPDDFVPSGHFSANGHRRVAEAIQTRLSRVALKP